MKQIILTSFVYIFITSIIFSQDGWEHQWWGTPDFFDVSASSDSIAWYAGQGTLVRVTPSYKYWYHIDFEDDPFILYTSIFTPKGSLGESCYVTARYGTIYKTNNYVDEWNQVYSYDGNDDWFINGIYFWDENEGIAFGDPVSSDLSRCYMVKTLDGGITWNYIADIPDLSQSWGILTFWDVYEDKVWYPIFTDDSTENNIILFSDNKGSSFQSIDVPEEFSQGSFTTTWSDENNGFISNGYGLTSSTSDGGVSWSSPIQNDDLRIRYVKCAKETQTIFARHYSEIIRSDDWGLTWYSQGEPSNARVKSFDVLDENMVWAAGDNQLILKTTNGGGTLSNYNQPSNAIVPKGISLEQNYPNPFNPLTKIRFSLDQSGPVRLSVYNLIGQEVRSLLNNRELSSGYHTGIWDGHDNNGRALPTGNYFYKIEQNGIIVNKKMLLMK